MKRENFEKLDKYRIGELNNIYYIKDFISTSEEEWLLSEIDAEKSKWIQLHHRRLQVFGGIPHPDGTLRKEMSTHLKTVCEWIRKCNFNESLNGLNQILMNEYTSGAGIQLHKDGPL